MVCEGQAILDVTDSELTVTVRVPEGRWLWLVSPEAGSLHVDVLKLLRDISHLSHHHQSLSQGVSPAGLGPAIPGAKSRDVAHQPPGTLLVRVAILEEVGPGGMDREMPIRRGGEGHRRLGASSLALPPHTPQAPNRTRRPASLLCGPGGVPAPASLAVPWARVWCYHCFRCAVRPWPVAETPWECAPAGEPWHSPDPALVS